MKKRANRRRSQTKLISKAALKFLRMIRRRKQRSLSLRRASTPHGGGGAGAVAVISGHEDLVVEILARLPVKSLFRFRCVCTTWRSLVSSDPHFVKKHSEYGAGRAANDADTRVLFFMKPPCSVGMSEVKEAELEGRRFSVRELRWFRFPAGLDESSLGNAGYVGSCNGIVCVEFDLGNLFVLWNPCTGEHNVLPKPTGVWLYAQYCGFGYDRVTDDYKVVKGSWHEYFEDGPEPPMVHVFSLRRGTWNSYLGPESCYIKRKGACVNGVLHWLRDEEIFEEGSKEVWRFSLAEERFLEAMPLLSSNFIKIFVSQNRLCVYKCTRGRVRVLMMKEYGVRESWTRVLYINNCALPEIYDDLYAREPVWIMENGDVLVKTYIRKRGYFLSLYKSKEKAFRHVVKINRRENEITYRDTLVSPITGSFKDSFDNIGVDAS